MKQLKYIKMKILKYIQLYNYLVSEEGLNPISAYRSIQRIRVLPSELKNSVLQVMQGEFPNIEYHGVTLNELIENEHMKPVRAILMLDWIRREPAVAMRYMETERLRAPMQFSDSDKDKIKKALERLNSKGSCSLESSSDKTDIEISD